jgi:hypothetical protein
MSVRFKGDEKFYAPQHTQAETTFEYVTNPLITNMFAHDIVVDVRTKHR